MSLKAEQFQTGAVVYDISKQSLSPHGIVWACEATPKKYPPKNFQFYCPDCQELGHFTRLVRIKETNKRSPQGYVTPAKFDLYKREHQTHKCNHTVRFKELENLATRYEAVALGQDHSYAFPITIDRREAESGIHDVRRLEKVLYACLYDEDLRDKQFFDLRGARHSVKDLFNIMAAEGHVKNKSYYAAAIFRPLARADLRAEYAYKGEISGMNNTVLSCSTETYGAVRKMAARQGGNASAPILVFAKAVLNVENLEGRQPFTRYVVDYFKQVRPWDHPTSFDAMIKNQAEPPPPYNLALFNPPLALKRA